MGDIDLRQRGEDLPLGVTLRIVSGARLSPALQRLCRSNDTASASL